MTAPAILLDKVSVRYRIPRERIGSLKEYAIRRLKRRLYFDEFEALKEVSLEVPGGETVGVLSMRDIVRCWTGDGASTPIETARSRA